LRHACRTDGANASAAAVSIVIYARIRSASQAERPAIFIAVVIRTAADSVGSACDTVCFACDAVCATAVAVICGSAADSIDAAFNACGSAADTVFRRATASADYWDFWDIRDFYACGSAASA
jgi:hypothetical protein